MKRPQPNETSERVDNAAGAGLPVIAVFGLGLAGLAAVWLWNPQIASIPPEPRTSNVETPSGPLQGHSVSAGGLTPNAATSKPTLFPSEAAAASWKEVPADQSTEVLKATVRLSSDSGAAEGLGAIIAHDNLFTYILSAGHLSDDSGRLHVQAFSSSDGNWSKRLPVRVRVVAEDRRSDLLLLRVTPPIAQRSRLPIASAPAQRHASAQQVIGVQRGRQRPHCVLRVARGPQSVQRPDGATSEMWELDQATLPGDSGGPLVDDKGQLIGIASGTSRGSAFYTHVEEILSFLDENALDWLTERHQ